MHKQVNACFHDNLDRTVKGAVFSQSLKNINSNRHSWRGGVSSLFSTSAAVPKKSAAALMLGILSLF